MHAVAAPRAPLGFYLREAGADPAATFHAIAAKGFREVELAGFRDRRPSETRKLLDAAGLSCKTVCWSMWLNDGDSQETIDAAVELGALYLVTPDPSRMGKEWFEPAVPERMTLNDWRWNADWFNHVGGLAQKNDIQFAYRNQSFDFARLGNSTGFDELYRRTEPTRVKFELDCAAATAGGCPPQEFLKRYADRTHLLHISDPADGTDGPEIRYRYLAAKGSEPVSGGQ